MFLCFCQSEPQCSHKHGSYSNKGVYLFIYKRYFIFFYMLYIMFLFILKFLYSILCIPSFYYYFLLWFKIILYVLYNYYFYIFSSFYICFVQFRLCSLNSFILESLGALTFMAIIFGAKIENLWLSVPFSKFETGN